MIGRVLQGIGGFYTIHCEGNEYVCKPRGRFRRAGLTPLVGDWVEFTPGAEGDEGSFSQILPRANALARPPVANLDLLLLAFAGRNPEPDLLLLDRLLVRARQAGLETALVANKCDLAPVDGLLAQYAATGCACFAVSAHTGEGLPALLEALRGKTVGFAGQSAVGKSSLINRLCPRAGLEVGDLSRIERGRHTTRKAQLLPLEGGGYLVDTPGFSLLELEAADPITLKDAYPEFAQYAEGCRFLHCNHVNEPGCAVRAAAEAGLLSKERLVRYTLLFAELTEKWGKRYG